MRIFVALFTALLLASPSAYAAAPAGNLILGLDPALFGLAAAFGVSLLFISYLLFKARRERNALIAEIDHTRALAEAGSMIEVAIDAPPKPAVLHERESARVAGAPLAVPASLAEAAAQGNLILVAGRASWIREGGPGWREFLAQAIEVSDSQISGPESYEISSKSSDSLRSLLRQSGGDSVVDILDRRNGRDWLIEVAKRAFAKVKPTQAFRRLCRQVPFQGYISLGFDDLFEPTIISEDLPRFTAHADRDFELLVRDSNRFVLRLAGDIERPATISWTASQLREAISVAPDLRSALISIFSSNTVLFVGAEASEIEELWNALDFYGATSVTHYALAEGNENFELIAERFSRLYNFELLEVNGPQQFETFVQDLVTSADRHRRAMERRTKGQVTTTSTIRALKLENIGPFEKSEIAFPTNWTVVLGNNGAGKSTILRALALALCGTDRGSGRSASSLLRRGSNYGVIEMTIETGSRQSIYQVSLIKEGNRVTVKAGVSPLQAGNLVAFGFTAVRGVSLSTPTMQPIDMHPDPLPRITDVSPLLDGGLDTRTSDLRAWLRSTYAVIQDELTSDVERHRARAKIDTFFQVIDDLAPGFDIRFSRVDSTTREILLTTSDGEIPLDYVSQGMSSMIGWVGTAIQRLFEICPPDADPRQASAIILIDEIDSHLHPEWQQRLVPTIRRIFPHWQVIASTHSALMVGSLEAGEVTKIGRTRDGLDIDPIEKSFLGYRVDQILTDEAFDLDSSRSPGWQELRSEYAELLGMSERNAVQEARYLELDALMDEAPPPFEARSDRADHEAARSTWNAGTAAPEGRQ